MGHKTCAFDCDVHRTEICFNVTSMLWAGFIFSKAPLRYGSRITSAACACDRQWGVRARRRRRAGTSRCSVGHARTAHGGTRKHARTKERRKKDERKTKERRKKDERRKNNPLACLNTIERHIERLVLPEKNHKDIIVHVSKTGMHTTTSSHVLGVRGVRRPCRRFCFGFFGVRRPSRAGNAKTVSARAGRPKPTTSPPSFRVPKSPTFSLIYVS